MGDMGEIYQAGKEIIRAHRHTRAERWEPLLDSAGAEYKAPGVWEYNGWLCYPTKGFAMLKKNNRIRKSLHALLKQEGKQ